MERIVPWEAPCSVIEPHYPKPDNGRPPVSLERMLMMYRVQRLVGEANWTPSGQSKPVLIDIKPLSDAA